MMDLQQYLSANSLRQEDFAQDVGISQPVVSKLARGLINPGPDLARRIHDKTGGQVPFWVWRPFAGFAPRGEADQ